MAFRFPVGLLERLDAFAAKLSRSMPGLPVARADAVRMLLERALEAEGYGAERPRRSSRG